MNPPRVELSAPDISPWRDGGTGTEWVHVLLSDRPGPTVLVQALTHGNEICGAIALDALMREGLAKLSPALGVRAPRSPRCITSSCSSRASWTGARPPTSARST
jgi:hypothetical protein